MAAGRTGTPPLACSGLIHIRHAKCAKPLKLLRIVTLLYPDFLHRRVPGATRASQTAEKEPSEGARRPAQSPADVHSGASGGVSIPTSSVPPPLDPLKWGRRRRLYLEIGLVSGFLSGVSLCVGLLTGLAGYYLAALVTLCVGVRTWFYATMVDRRDDRTVPAARAVKVDRR